jgi:hypothetical protein
MTDDAREAWLELIRAHIATYGHHITLVSGGPLPRFAYTIGLSPSVGFELVLAGAASLSAAEVRRTINDVAAQVVASDGRPRAEYEVEGLGPISLLDVDGSWIGALLLGARDFYGSRVRAMQIRPDSPHRTVDVPDLSRSWDPNAEPVWRWLDEPWDYPVPPKSMAATNLAALRGATVTEVVRWEEDYWEMFAGPDVTSAAARVVPLGILLGADPLLEIVTALEIGRGVWRDPDEPGWHAWGPTAT